MARQSAGRRNTDDIETEELDETDAAQPAEAEVEDEELERGPEVDAFWESVHVDVLEIALPKGVGYTLRAYRPETEVTPTDISERESDAFPDRQRPTRAFAGDEKAIAGYDEDEDEDEDERPVDEADDALDADDEDDDLDESDEDDEDEEDEDGEDEEGDEDEDEEGDEAGGEAARNEEVPVFLGRRGRLYLFRTPEGLAEYVRSGAEHDLSQLATWPQVVEGITAERVVPLEEDRYELDLVVENLRGGYDAWDAPLLIQAGEIARDLGYALRLPSVMDSLAPGSPLDDLDEVMRTAESGGVSGFFARRKLKKIGAEAAPLSWRTIIGKISAAVDWRD